jgi:hypothetical protein
VTISIRIILLGAAGTGRRISFVATGAVLAIALMLADEPADAQEHHLLPEISVPEPAPRGGDPKHCSDVKNGGDQSLDCLNEKLRQKVDQVNPVLNAPPVDARSQDLKVGTVNVPAVQQQYGKNFGNSVIPYRPPPPVYSSPLVHR